MIAVARTDTSILGRWWWTVDRWSLLALALLMGFGAILILAASPAAGERIGLDGFYLAQRQLAFLPLGGAAIIAISLLSPLSIRRLAVLGYLGGLLLLAATLVVGVEINGASRWLNIAGLSVQPSEFVKPCLAVTAAWMFAAQRRDEGVPGNAIAMALLAITVTVLLMQPDVGQSFVVTAVWGIQFFVAGLPMVWVLGLGAAGITGLVGAYFLLPHVTDRIDTFLDPAAGDRYQVNRALEAFQNGGLLGRGPGEGTVKATLPDAHSDFIFAVAGEEFGAIVCLMIVALFAFVVLRGFSRLLNEENLFVLLAGTGLLAQFGMQAAINMASTLHLMPTKGMTLPFISYGGSSLLALALGMGMLLGLTRRRVSTGDEL
ncbi:FtsW/RodA/SpoVE family cell cycle protein [Ferruginivarius sediminum]|uniref:Probable peptidoglycan glycosyltransferase FtsW n=1 Tax=Ferruginivarius sediminum TaxID=2661937 RepID=A0A369T7K2_9PROT|nr:putative peptidoglycan glycosyltransferase FtsW [Ferruginivarius sediminum]RDD61290.1 cell division protein FtsW [Ferruginivarius sediminum]